LHLQSYDFCLAHGALNLDYYYYESSKVQAIVCIALSSLCFHLSVYGILLLEVAEAVKYSHSMLSVYLIHLQGVWVSLSTVSGCTNGQHMLLIGIVIIQDESNSLLCIIPRRKLVTTHNRRAANLVLL
jgi:hypothetical protein